MPARAARLAAPNVVEINPLLVTSGQPRASALQGLSQLEFAAVLYLAPFTVSDAVRNEPTLLQAQGIEFVHIPIPFGEPTEAHFLEVSEHLVRLKIKRTLVHCQVNMRASSMVFLHRVIALGEPAATAYQAVSQVWSPHGPWLTLLQQQLRKHKVDFEPF
jgi:protein tyrosine phosphatase (PTP) superfamily phosphohydrolase (DUF442 family)